MPSRKPSATKGYKPQTIQLAYHFKGQAKIDHAIKRCVLHARKGLDFPRFLKATYEVLAAAMGQRGNPKAAEDYLRSAYRTELAKLGDPNVTIYWNTLYKYWRPLSMKAHAVDKRKLRARHKRQAGESEASISERHNLKEALKRLPPVAYEARRKKAQENGGYWGIHTI